MIYRNTKVCRKSLSYTSLNNLIANENVQNFVPMFLKDVLVGQYQSKDQPKRVAQLVLLK